MPVPHNSVATRKSSHKSNLSLSKDEAKAIYRSHAIASASSSSGGFYCGQRPYTQDADSSTPDKSKNEEEEDLEEDWIDETVGDDLSEEIDAHLLHLGKAKSSRLTQKEDAKVKRLFQKAWTARKLSCDMDAPSLALGVTKLKIDLLEHDMNSAIGSFATKHISKYRDAKYRSAYRFWIRRYHDCFKYYKNKLSEKEELMGASIGIQEKKNYLLKKVSINHSRTYDDWKRSSEKPLSTEIDTMTRAKKAGERILSIARERTGNSNLQLKDLSMEELAHYSKEIEVMNISLPAQERVSRESIKKYLKRYLGKNNQQIDDFSIQCLEYRMQYLKEQRIAKAEDRQADP